MRYAPGHPSTLRASHPGNTSRLRHGVWSANRQALEPGAQEIAEAILAEPHVAAIDEIGAVEIGRLEALIEAVDRDLGELALEVEAGRGARGNAVYRDLIQTSLLVDARFLVLAVQIEYHHKSGGKDVIVQSYRDTRNLLDAIYASNRLQLPLGGILLVGY
jgi:hypothetical protein